MKSKLLKAAGQSVGIAVSLCAALAACGAAPAHHASHAKTDASQANLIQVVCNTFQAERSIKASNDAIARALIVTVQGLRHDTGAQASSLALSIIKDNCP